MQFLFASQQSHARNEADEAEIMVAMQVRNENMMDLASSDAVPGYLHLGTLTAIDQEYLVVQGNYLRRRVPVIGRDG